MNDAEKMVPRARVVLPCPPEGRVDLVKIEMEIYVRFMRHLRCVANSREDIRILSSIQFVADMMGRDDAEISSVLVTLRLRAPRMAFPERYLEFIDMILIRDGEFSSIATNDLKRHWDHIGEDRFAPCKRHYPVSVGCCTASSR